MSSVNSEPLSAEEVTGPDTQPEPEEKTAADTASAAPCGTPSDAPSTTPVYPSSGGEGSEPAENKGLIRKFRENWPKIPLYMKIATAVGMLLSVAVIVLASLSLLGIMPDAGNIFVPLLGLLMIANAVQSWQLNRKSSYISIAAAVIIFIIVAVRFFVK